ncbi:unnamed protein product [Rhizoctonia solani]|uniref:ATPase inhibitor, mitochondrial n=1 Tax=Rhizoctonia solani TaxID=456999 RepID=A0A8H7IEN9_9AGAM|nr:uncharacterized protein RhiXN_11709 [Rhizoctonia solani]KAF8683447.1 hypothetical protein RHS04_01936 [Rhizoctonia solani]KAF8756180.1 hypothetical protein RHS01_04929 [Rhizoctonia solani]QRW24797.1 hypothetical protein RhiXN_11709 [Rhizoctonia solani]CAE6450248.1 unnamed protein product [Rhizoctonia solani]
MIARIAIRTAARSSRVAAPRATAVRFYSEDQFGRKEKAHEDQYVRKHQEEQIKKLKEQLAKNKEESAKLEKEINERESKNGRK